MVKEGKREKKLLGEALTWFDKIKAIKGNKKALKKALDELPIHLKSHPGIVAFRNENFVKEKSSGRDLVYYCGMTGHEWYDGAPGFIGGSEEAVINLTRQLAKMGWKVIVYNNCGHIGRTVNGVVYRPFWEFNYRDKQDVVILWRSARPLDAPINAPKVYLDAHDVMADAEFNEQRLARVTKVFVKSQFHRSLTPSIPDDKVVVIPNGIDLSLLQGNIKRDPMLVINTSSPDRSMDVLPKLWERVKKEVPKAKLQWAYGFEIFMQSYKNDAKKVKWMEDTKKEMKRVGIEVLGRLDQKGIGELYQRASILAYPSTFAEIFCISLLKAQAAGCIPITTDFGAFKEVNKFGVQIHTKITKDTWAPPYTFHFGLQDEKEQDAWVNAVVAQLKSGSTLDVSKVSAWASDFTWVAVAKKWDEELCAPSKDI